MKPASCRPVRVSLVRASRGASTFRDDLAGLVLHVTPPTPSSRVTIDPTEVPRPTGSASRFQIRTLEGKHVPDRTADPSEAKIQALSALYQTEIGANVGELQATTLIVIGLLAYLSATIFFLGQLSPTLLSLLPLGVLFGATYQMLRAAVVVRRARLARAYERSLVEIAGFDPGDYDRGKAGSMFYGQLDDLNIIRGQQTTGLWSKIGRWSNIAVAVAAYSGLYLLSIGYTAVILKEMWSKNVRTGYGMIATLGYSAAWIVFAFAAWHLFEGAEPAKRRGA